MMQKVSESTTWEALECMRKYKRSIPRFDFRIRLDKNTGCLCALYFMTHDHRNNLLRNRSVINAMKYNLCRTVTRAR